VSVRSPSLFHLFSPSQNRQSTHTNLTYHPHCSLLLLRGCKKKLEHLRCMPSVVCCRSCPLHWALSIPYLYMTTGVFLRKHRNGIFLSIFPSPSGVKIVKNHHPHRCTRSSLSSSINTEITLICLWCQHNASFNCQVRLKHVSVMRILARASNSPSSTSSCFPCGPACRQHLLHHKLQSSRAPELQKGLLPRAAHSGAIVVLKRRCTWASCDSCRSVGRSVLRRIRGASRVCIVVFALELIHDQEFSEAHGREH